MNNLKAKVHRMELKLDKVDETDAIHAWTTQQIDNTRFKIQDFID